MPAWFAAAAVRAWARLYTWRLEPAVRLRRLEEIDSDLWESQHDAVERRAGPVHLILRLLTGIPDDLFWRLDQRHAAEGRQRLGAALALGAAGAVALWLVIASMSARVPSLPGSPRLEPRPRLVDSPPPPPPPPCAPPGFPGLQTDCVR